MVVCLLYFCETQVGSPAVRLRLAHCTSLVKQGSEAMDLLVLQIKRAAKKVQILTQWYDPIKRTFSTSNLPAMPTLGPQREETQFSKNSKLSIIWPYLCIFNSCIVSIMAHI